MLGCEAVNFWDICELFLAAEFTSDSAEQHQKITKSKKIRRRRKVKDKTNDLTKKNRQLDVDLDQLQSHDQDIPIDAHSIPESAKSPTPSVTLADTDQVVVKDHIDINVDDDHNVY